MAKRDRILHEIKNLEDDLFKSNSSNRSERQDGYKRRRLKALNAQLAKLDSGNKEKDGYDKGIKNVLDMGKQKEDEKIKAFSKKILSVINYWAHYLKTIKINVPNNAGAYEPHKQATKIKDNKNKMKLVFFFSTNCIVSK